MSALEGVLRSALASVRTGDTLVVTKLDRLARSLRDATDIADELTKKGVALNLGGSVYDPTDPVGRHLFNVLGMVAEFEADLIRARTREGMAIAKAASKLRGGKPKLNEAQEKHLVELHRAGTHTTSNLAELFGVARATVYRAVHRADPKERTCPRRLASGRGTPTYAQLMTVRRVLDFMGVTEPKSERKNDGTGSDGRWAVPIRRVFPWWYVAGAVVTVGVLIVLNPDGSQAMAAFWGPTIGITIRDREKAARTRLDEGLPVDRASLLSPRWLEPVCAALLSVFAIGAGLLLDALFGHRTFVTVWDGTAFLAGSALGFLLLIVVLRARRRRRRRRTATS